MRYSVEALLFDIDGTLVDSTAAVERTWRRWAADRGLDPEHILRVCHGRRSEDTIAQFLPAAERTAAVAELERLELGDLDDVVALPGTAALLCSLPKGRWAAVTSGPPDLMTARLTVAGLPVPRVLVTSVDVAAGKPDPEGYLKAARALGVDPRQCLVVEDAPAGIDAGIAAGARVLAVATSHPADQLRAATAIVPDLDAVVVEAGPDGLTVSTSGRSVQRLPQR